MNKLTLADIKPLPEYEKVRADFRRKVIEMKKNRRVGLGNRITLVFENRETLILQVQEIMRTEHLYDQDKIQAEIDIYNTLVPGPGELSATLFIEITEPDRIRETLDQLQGIDTGNTLFMEIGQERVYGEFEAGHSKEDKISAVHYVRFRLAPAQQAALGNPVIPAAMAIEHPAYRARTALLAGVRESLVKDLSS